MANAPRSRTEYTQATPVAITRDYVRDIFKGLESSDAGSFFEHVADDVDWIVMGFAAIRGGFQVRDALVAEEIEVDPVVGAAALGTT